MKVICRTMLVVLLLAFLSGCGKKLDIGGLYPILQNKKWGYMDKSGKVVIQPQFEEVRLFSGGLAAVTLDHKKWGFIDRSGHFVVNPQYDAVAWFSEGLAAVIADHKVGYIDTTGKTVINPQFETHFSERERFLFGFFASFSEGRAVVQMGDKMGYIDKTGKLVINPQYTLALPFSEGLASVQVEAAAGEPKKSGYIDPTGKMMINPQFEEIAAPFTHGLALVYQSKKFGYIDKKGNYVINPQFEMATPFSDEGIAGVLVGGKWGGIDKTGKLVINPQFEQPQPESEPTEESIMMVLEIAARDIGRVAFSDGLAFVCANHKFGYVDKAGNYVINPQFELAGPFLDGLAMVMAGKGKDAKYGWIDKTGKYVWNPTN